MEKWNVKGIRMDLESNWNKLELNWNGIGIEIELKWNRIGIK